MPALVSMNTFLLSISLSDTFLIAAFTQAKHAVARSVLIDAANDKCAQTRRKRKTVG